MSDALPTEPGLYRTPDRSQDHMDEWHTDGWEFHYLNNAGNWSDIGWGAPSPGQALHRAVAWARRNPASSSSGGGS